MSELGAVFQATNNGGNYVFSPEEYRLFVDHLKKLPRNIEVIIRPKSNSRSNNQNKYYRVVLSLIAESTGHTVDFHHQVFKKSLLGGVSTTTLTTEQFNDFLEQVKAWAAEYNIIIPDPERVDFEN